MTRFAKIIAGAAAAGVIAALVLPIPMAPDRKRSPRRACISNLNLIDGAKAQWALERQKSTDAVPTMSDLAPYMKTVPKCPAGGVYTVGPLSKLPTCSVKGHSIGSH